MIDEKVEELVGVLLNVVVELLLLFAQPGDELLGRNRADLLLLRGNAVEQIGQAGEQRLLGALVLRLVLEHFVAEGLTEVERLENGIAVACVAELQCINGGNLLVWVCDEFVKWKREATSYLTLTRPK